MNGQKNNEKGFTIIEVVLVLAIAALIFLMVFIALPALQRSQRDTQRKDDVARVQTAVNSYQSNNRNKLPAFGTQFVTGYLRVGGDQFADPDGTEYKFIENSATGFAPSEFKAGEMYFTKKAKCEGEETKTGQGTSKVAIQYKLEGGGTACVNN